MNHNASAPKDLERPQSTGRHSTQKRAKTKDQREGQRRTMAQARAQAKQDRERKEQRERERKEQQRAMKKAAREAALTPAEKADRAAVEKAVAAKKADRIAAADRQWLQDKADRIAAAKWQRLQDEQEERAALAETRRLREEQALAEALARVNRVDEEPVRASGEAKARSTESSAQAKQLQEEQERRTGQMLGDTFKSARESKALSLEYVFQCTKIKPRFLEAIEKNEFDQLPGGIYNRQFIRSYAECLGMDVSEVLASFDRLPVTQPTISERQHEQMPESRSHPTAESDRIPVHGPSIIDGFIHNALLISLGIIALFLIFDGFYYCCLSLRYLLDPPHGYTGFFNPGYVYTTSSEYIARNAAVFFRFKLFIGNLALLVVFLNISVIEFILSLTVSWEDASAMVGDIEEEYRTQMLPKKGHMAAFVWYCFQLAKLILVSFRNVRLQRLAELLLWIIMNKEDANAMIGDLEEEYMTHILPERGRVKAYAWYCSQIAKSVPSMLRREIPKLVAPLPERARATASPQPLPVSDSERSANSDAVAGGAELPTGSGMATGLGIAGDLKTAGSSEKLNPNATSLWTFATAWRKFWPVCRFVSLGLLVALLFVAGGYIYHKFLKHPVTPSSSSSYGHSENSVSHLDSVGEASIASQFLSSWYVKQYLSAAENAPPLNQLISTSNRGLQRIVVQHRKKKNRTK